MRELISVVRSALSSGNIFEVAYSCNKKIYSWDEALHPGIPLMPLQHPRTKKLGMLWSPLLMGSQHSLKIILTTSTFLATLII